MLTLLNKLRSYIVFPLGLSVKLSLAVNTVTVVKNKQNITLNFYGVK